MSNKVTHKYQIYKISLRLHRLKNGVDALDAGCVPLEIPFTFTHVLVTLFPKRAETFYFEMCS